MTEDFLLGGTRDECAFYQAETQTLTRENQMLKHRIRELERQISDFNSTNLQGSGSAAAQAQNSPLATSSASLVRGTTLFHGEASTGLDAKVD